MNGDLLDWLPNIPISTEGALILSTLIVSLATALGALIRNRRAISVPIDDGNDMGAILENPSSILPHLIELRDRVIRSLVAIAIGTVLAALLANQILVLLAEPIGGLDRLLLYRVTEGVSVFFRVSLTVGIILASPYVIAQLWIFIAAGLKPSERRVFYLLFPFAVALFITGVAFAYFIMLPVAVPFLIEFLNIRATPTLDDYVQFVTTILIWVGISFEIPLIVFGLAKAKLINAKTLAQNWRIAIVLIAVLSAIITPTPDPINMGIVAAPLFLLYLLSIALAALA